MHRIFYRLLLVEDDPLIASSLTDVLQERVVVEHAPSCAIAKERIRTLPYDAVILDITLPDGSGLSCIPVIKKSLPSCGILVLSGETDESQKVAALEAGADDYVTKPFTAAEFRARVDVILRRQFTSSPRHLFLGAFCFDQAQAILTKKNVPVHLTPQPRRLLQALARTPNVAVTRSKLIEALWDDAIEVSDQALDVVVRRLRSVLEPGNVTVIESVYGVGYRLVTSHEEDS